jgi:hypothetical protein
VTKGKILSREHLVVGGFDLEIGCGLAQEGLRIFTLGQSRVSARRGGSVREVGLGGGVGFELRRQF